MSESSQPMDLDEDLPRSPSLDNWHHCPEERQSHPFCFSCGGDGHFAEDCELGKVKVCQRCGGEGHYDNQCTAACPNCDEDHLPGDCPTAKATCFLCMGSDHSPKECTMNQMIARSLKMQRLLLQSSVSFAVAHASQPEEFLGELSEKLWDKPPVYTFPDFQIMVEDPVIPGGWKRKRKDRRECRERTQGDFSKVANITCFFCNLKDHYAIDCPKDLAATSRLLQAVPQSRAPAIQQGGFRPLAEVTCFLCKIKGHYANTCPKKPVATSHFFPQPVIRAHVPVAPSSGLRNFADVTCFFCDRKGHYANSCPLKRQKIACAQVNSIAAGKRSGDN